jgi:hypothetical protein
LDKKTDIIDKIKLSVQQISLEEESVRKYINTTRYQTNLLRDLDVWNQICSSLDTIGDTIYSIEDYLNSEYPESTGLRYIFTYGILQSLFIQQDAIKHLAEAFEVDFRLDEKLRNIRAIRNASIGHPTKNIVKGTIFYNYISRITISKSGFTFMRSSERNRTDFVEVDLYSIMLDQLDEIKKSYGLISAKLIEEDRMHREKHKNKLVVDIFHSSMGYSFSKVAEGINAQAPNRTFGLSMLRSIEETYQKFETELRERNELNEYIKYDLEEYIHAIEKLKSFLLGDNDYMNEIDARIYLFYIREEHSHFVKIAEEIDEEYNKKV